MLASSDLHEVRKYVGEEAYLYRDHNKVTDLESMKHIMRYNEYETDPLSLHDACKSISGNIFLTHI